jgi:cardiolipin synthase A/B
MATPRTLLRNVGKTLRAGWRRVAHGRASAARGAKTDVLDLRYSVPGDAAGFSCALQQSVGIALASGHDVTVIDNSAVFDALIDDITRAHSSVNVVIYIWEPGQLSDRIVAALVERARAGVACRLLVDVIGSPRFERDIAPTLLQAGCNVLMFRPGVLHARLRRNHRKICILDGRIAYTGGFGLRDCWLGDGCSAECWRDVSVRFLGPAVAAAQQAFAENWQEAGGALLPEADFPASPPAGTALAGFVSSTASPSVTRAERVTQLFIAAARQRIWISNAYFVPPRAILDQLARKAAAGLDVRVLVAGKVSDSKTSFTAQQFEYDELLDAGVRVWEYQPSMLHSKVMVVDDCLVSVGSVNLDPLSLNQLEEGLFVAHDSALAARLADSHLADCVRAEQQGRRKPG